MNTLPPSADKDPRHAYIDRLAEWRAHIAEYVADLEAHRLTQERIQATLRYARALEEGAMQHGFANIRSAAAALGQALQHEQHMEDTARALMLACDNARRVLPGSSIQQIDRKMQAAGGRKPVLLVVDDDRVIREIVTSLFEQQAEIRTAENSAQALEIIHACRPDLILLDDIMPGGLSGLRFLETLRETPELAKLDVIMLTGSKGASDIERGRAAGALEYIVKPFDPLALFHTVSRFLVR